MDNSEEPHGEERRQPTQVDELTRRNIETIVRLEDTERRQRTVVDRVADAITDFCGSIGFVWVHVLWFGAWIGWNLWPGLPRFDAFPFAFLTLIVSLEAIFLSTFILISQNRQSRISERRSHLDLQIDLLAEQENTKTLELLTRIAEKVGVTEARDAMVQALEQATHPDRVVEQIDRTMAVSLDPESGTDPGKELPEKRTRTRRE